MICFYVFSFEQHNVGANHSVGMDLSTSRPSKTKYSFHSGVGPPSGITRVLRRNDTTRSSPVDIVDCICCYE